MPVGVQLFLLGQSQRVAMVFAARAEPILFFPGQEEGSSILAVFG
jgi:hypothetical protein